MRRHQYLLVPLVLLSFISISLAQTSSTSETHNEDVIDLDHDIAQPTRAPGAASPTTRPTAGIRIPPRTTRGDDMSRPRVIDRPTRTIPRDPATSRRMKRLTMMERRMLMRLFRKLFLLRIRTMEDQYPFGMPRWERRMLGWMMLNDLMMMMDVQAEEANEIAHMIEEQEEMEQSNNENIHDQLETETTEPEVEIEEAEPETEVADVEEHQVADPRDDPRLIDPTLIESEFEISAPYGGYGGGFGYGGYGGGYGGKKKGGYGGFGYGGGKKGGYGGGYKKVPYKKVPYKKVPIKKGPPKKKGGFGGYGFGGGYI